MSAKNSKTRRHIRRESAVVRLRSALAYAQKESESYATKAKTEKDAELRNDFLSFVGDLNGKVARLQKAIDNTEAKL